MAVSANSYFGNAIVGQPQAGADFNIYDDHTTARYAVGTGFTRSDGAKFRYGHFGLASDAGLIVGTDGSESSSTWAGLTVNPSSAGKNHGEIMNTGDRGSHYVQGNFTLNGDQMAGGYLMVTAGSGAGYQYRIRGNSTTMATGTTDVELYEPLIVSIGSDSGIMLMGNQYANLEPTDSGPGVAVNNRAAGITTVGHTLGNYGWIQTSGIAIVKSDVNVTAGGPLVLGATGGTVAPLSLSVPNVAFASESDKRIGWSIEQFILGSWGPAEVSFE